MAVYGNFLSAFPELFRKISVFTKADKSDMRVIRGVYMPTKGDALVRQKLTNRGKALQYFGNDCLFVGRHWKDKVSVGDYFYAPDDTLCRIVGMSEWQFEGSFTRFLTEKVSGASVDHTEELKVKEAQFD